MWLFLAIASFRETPEEFCGTFSNTDCDYCLSNINNYTCGYCIDDKRCVPGDESGPFEGTCVQWTVDKSSDICVADSYLGFSTPVRIGVGCAIGVIIIFTLLFWLVAFPRIFRPKDEIINGGASVDF